MQADTQIHAQTYLFTMLETITAVAAANTKLLLLLRLITVTGKPHHGQHVAVPRQSLWRQLMLAGKSLVVVAEAKAETAAGPEDRTTIFRTALCQWWADSHFFHHFILSRFFPLFGPSRDLSRVPPRILLS